jgi:hypothetical protein
MLSTTMMLTETLTCRSRSPNCSYSAAKIEGRLSNVFHSSLLRVGQCSCIIGSSCELDIEATRQVCRVSDRPSEYLSSGAASPNICMSRPPIMEGATAPAVPLLRIGSLEQDLLAHKQLTRAVPPAPE